MTSSERVREEIARVLRGARLTDRPAEFDSSIHSWRCEYPDRYGSCGCFDELVSDLEKAILSRWPVLAGVTDEMVETAARALNRNGWTCDGGSDEPGRYDECEYCRRACAGTVRAVLSAVLGPRDADAPGDGVCGRGASRCEHRTGTRRDRQRLPSGK